MSVNLNSQNNPQLLQQRLNVREQEINALKVQNRHLLGKMEELEKQVKPNQINTKFVADDVQKHLEPVIAQMHSMMNQAQQAKTPAERQKLMAEHMNAMQEQMAAMHGMMGAGGMMGQNQGGAAMGPNAPSQMMQQRMDMMQQMMEQMMAQQQLMMKPAR